ncbi:MAG: family 16 glycosylhydrolase [Bacteroidales bacterium]|nr:family 16 glycosylhydrolase [Bacteroidales bacterium]
MSILSILLSSTVVLCACGGSGEDSPISADSLKLSAQSIVISAESSQTHLSISASGEWRAFATNGEDWIQVSPDYGSAGDYQLTIAATENISFKPREGQLTVKCGTNRQYVKVSQQAATKPSIACPLEGYELAWHDEFDTDGPLTRGQGWSYQVADAGWVNNELQTYVDTSSPAGRNVAEVKDGILSINCFKENGKIYSGRVYAHQSTGWKYGYVEASICLPSGKGTWPAFWMMPVNFKSWPHDGEIDIMEEVGYHPNYVSSSLHADAHVHSNNTQVTKEVYCAGAEGSFHTYGMEWTKDYFQFYVDGKKTLYYPNKGLGVADWPYDAPFYVILNLAWGGAWGGQQGVDESALPVTMKVDWVRVWQK